MSAMRLLFSTDDPLNTDISDERGFVYYSISTPFAFSKVTTITKFVWNGQNGIPETMGIIEWHLFNPATFRFNGQVIPANVMLTKRAWSSGRYFIGPDRHTYKWKIESSHCWMKPAESNTQLARFHKQNLGFMKPAHPAYIDVCHSVVSMLDYIVITFIYVEQLRRQAQRQSRQSAAANLNALALSPPAFSPPTC